MGVGLRQVVAIVGSDKRNARLAREAHEVRINLLLFGEILVLDLEEEISFSENVLQIVSGLASRVVALGGKGRGNLSAQAR